MKKKATRKRTKTSSPAISYIRILLVASVILLLALSGKIISGISKPHVLGASTSILLADKGSDGSGSSGGDSGNGTSSGDSSSNSGNDSGRSDPSGSGESSITENTSSGGGGEITAETSTPTTNVSQSNQVDCIGPDGKHFTTSLHDCQELNQKWGKSHFSFTPLGHTQPSNENDNSQTSEDSSHGQLEVQTEKTKSELNLETPGLKLEIKQEDNGKLTIKAKKADGTEVELQQDALGQINEALKDQEVEVGTASAGELEIKSGSVSAHTTFPLSIDPTTNTLAVTTPAGTKDVAVLPDKAVAALLQHNILTNVFSQSPTNASPSGNTTAVIALTTQNNQAVFEIQGVKEKHLLGIFPVGFQKTVTVSAQTGQVLSTQESLINHILEALSL